jgi:hypothetical protein
MNFINLTPHELNIVREDGTIMNIPASGDVVRLATTMIAKETIAGIPVTAQIMGDITGLPKPQEDTIFLVSALVMLEAQRADVMSPGPAVRDNDGRIIGSQGLSAHPEV